MKRFSPGRFAPALAAAAVLLLAPTGSFSTPDAPLKSCGELVDEVAAFLFSDAGSGGIRTNDGDPDGYPVPPYFYHFGIYDSNALWSGGGGYPGYDSVSYPAYTASAGIDAFLAYHAYSGSDEALSRARGFADWILEHRTPAGDLYGDLPYSTQTEGVMGGGWDGDAIMTDKPPMFGLRLLRLFDVTGDSTYWRGAAEIAATMAATQLDGDASDRGRWPFRVRPSDGAVRQDYTSHLQPAVRFFDQMHARTGDAAYAEVRDRAWLWLLDNPCNPASPSYMRWEAFYEDQDPEMQTGMRDHYSAHEMIVELVARRPDGWRETAQDIMDWVDGMYLVATPDGGLGDYHPATLEWSGWPVATFAATLQYARTSLLLDRALRDDPLWDPRFAELAAGMVLVSTYGQNTRDGADDGRMFTTVKDIYSYGLSNSWYEQNFNTVKYLLEMMSLDPSLAPQDSPHLLSSESPVRQISYPPLTAAIVYSVSGGGGVETLRLPAPPTGVTAGGAALPQLAASGDPGPGWFWDPETGVLEVAHETGPVEISGVPTGVAGPAAGPGVRLRRVSATGASGVRFALGLSRPGPVTITVHDLRGRMVRRLLAGSDLAAGEHLLEWDGRDASGRAVAAGVYLLRAGSGGGATAIKASVVR